MDHTEEFFRQFDGVTYVYESGHSFKISIRRVSATPHRPGGIRYSLAFFDPSGTCLARFDNSHGVKVRGQRNPVAFDHWHRFSSGELVPYAFTSLQALVEDFFAAVDAHLPPELQSDRTKEERNSS